MTDLVTVEDLKTALPSRKNAITDEVVDIINKSQTEPEFQGESLLQSAVTYENIMKNGKYPIKEYLNAIRFSAYLISLDDNYTEAYKKTFYNRDFVKQRRNADTSSVQYAELTSAASRYRRSKLVTEVLTLSQVPLDLLFTGHRMRALGVLAELSTTAKLDRDKINAAKELLAATKNEDTKVALEIGPSAEAVSMQGQLDKQLGELALNQKKMLEAGYRIDDVQKTGLQLDIIEGEVDE